MVKIIQVVTMVTAGVTMINIMVSMTDMIIFTVFQIRVQHNCYRGNEQVQDIR